MLFSITKNGLLENLQSHESRNKENSPKAPFLNDKTKKEKGNERKVKK